MSRTRWFPIHDPQLLARLRAEIRPGDEVDVTYRNEYTDNDIQTYLIDCRKASAAASA